MKYVKIKPHISTIHTMIIIP
uniref:Uncharacterized protein n=1 Tax=Arundo donax TaxID=35708 RepID=A0A0A9AAM1_ARUDO